MKIVSCVLCFLLITLCSSIALADGPPTVTISQIQHYDGVAEGDRVRITGICTCDSGRFGGSMTMVTDPGGGAWASIAVYDTDQRLYAEAGDTIEAVGLVTEYFDKTEVNCTGETEFPPFVTGHTTVPSPIMLTTGTAAQEQYECCLITLRNVEIMSDPDGYFQLAIDDGSGEYVWKLSKNDPETNIGDVYPCMTGINDYDFGEFKIRVRDEHDLECSGEPTATPQPPTATPGGPTATPTTSGPTPTPTPTPPGGACDPVMSFYFEGHDAMNCFTPGDRFDAKFKIENNCDNDKDIDLYIALEVAGLFFFYPSWNEDVKGASLKCQANQDIIDNILPAFDWPTGAGAFAGIHFYGMMTVPDQIMTMVGDLAIIEFCYE